MVNDLQGKVFLVTGGTEGLGKAAARNFAQRGATLVLVARSPEKGKRVIGELSAASANPNLELILADLSSQAEVRRVAAEFRARHDTLHALVNNAGALFQTYQTTADGLEMTFALNHMSYFWLTTWLEELLIRTPGARVVNTSSGAHRMGGRIDIDTVATRQPKRDVGFRAYGESKLANVLFTRELARRLAPHGVRVNCFHPGFVATRFAQNNQSFVSTALKRFGRYIARTPEKGAETLVWLTTSPEAASFNGEYFHDRKVASVSREARSEALASQLWTLSEGLTSGGAVAAA
jgi:NAD(P)-dependent dehydrogenase (short-subunit alcohol dehydrogenase family)